MKSVRPRVFLCVCPSAWVRSCLSEVSEAQNLALYKVTTPSKRPGRHKRTLYDSTPSKEQFEEFKAHSQGEAGRGWKVQRKTRSETEDGREEE